MKLIINLADVLDIGISDVSLDILDLQECYHLVIESYDSAGLLKNFDAFSNFRWMSDLTGETSRGYWSKVYRGVSSKNIFF